MSAFANGDKDCAGFGEVDLTGKLIVSDSQWIGGFAEPGWIVKLNDIIKDNIDLIKKAGKMVLIKWRFRSVSRCRAYEESHRYRL